MTRRQIFIQLCQFLRVKEHKEAWRRAHRSVTIFSENSLVPFKELKAITFSYGKYSDEHGNYYGENRDTLNIDYTTIDGEKYHFAIMD